MRVNVQMDEFGARFRHADSIPSLVCTRESSGIMHHIMSKTPKYIIGIDEAGRGPLAGPVAVGVVKIAHDFDWDLIPGVGDSKLLSAKKRKVIFAQAQLLKKAGQLNFAVATTSAQQIDQIGIVNAISAAMKQAIRRLELSSDSCFIMLDGSLKAPSEYNQVTIIKGDQSEQVIGLASIIAKETRDAYMERIAKRFAPYDFHLHKGYGTKAHREIITKIGLSSVHRKTFCRNIAKHG